MAGNANSGKRKDRLFHAALMLELTEAGNGRDLRSIAQNVIAIALDKDHKDALSAAKEVADRVDGKVPQAVIGDDDADPINLVARIERVIVENS
jgi:hypothetical protein